MNADPTIDFGEWDATMGGITGLCLGIYILLGLRGDYE
jgi:hypothetical protein